MMHTVRTAALLAVPALVVAAPAFAHPGHEAAGFLHPFTGLDHLLAMLAVGMWASFLSVERRSAAILVPGSFLTMMGLGAAAGFAGIKLPLAEAAILASVFVFGALMIAAIRLPAAWAASIVGLFAVFHGYAHALEAPASAPGGYALSFLAATALLLVGGLGLGQVVRRIIGDLGLRALGGLVVAGAAFVLVAH
jgi:urease accessory protein